MLRCFEECYNELMSKPKYEVLKTYFNTDVEKAHNGYFSQDKKGFTKIQKVTLKLTMILIIQL